MVIGSTRQYSGVHTSTLISGIFRAWASLMIQVEAQAADELSISRPQKTNMESIGRPKAPDEENREIA